MKHIVNVPYKGNARTFDVYSRPLMDYFLDQAADPILAKQAEWNAVRQSRWTGTRWVPMYEEPITGQNAWDLQVSFHRSVSMSNS